MNNLITSINATLGKRWQWYINTILIYFLTFQTTQAQYTVNGNAFSTSCRCYTLTTRTSDFQSGSVWNNNRIDLRQSFDFYFLVNLGCADDGADGIAFVLQPISTSVGSSGGGMGFAGIQPSLGVTLDTYQNASPDNDPVFDHLAVQLNGDLNHNSSQTITPTIPISATSNNVEDCRDHVLQVKWDANTIQLQVFFDGQSRLSVNRDLVGTVFNNNSFVYWGFTGATGGATNVQSFCTALSPKFYFNANQRLCVNEPIRFIDSTVSFSSGFRKYWDFGDGSPIDSVQANPTHTYTVAGEYTVVYRVLAADGCASEFQKTINIGHKPIPDFTANPLCTDREIKLQDRSTVINANLQSWYWKVESSGQVFSQPNLILTSPQPGEQRISFSVTSSRGCTSDTLRRTIYIHPTPTFNAAASDVCVEETLTIQPQETTLDSMVVGQWLWNTSDGDQYTGTPLEHVFNSTGPASVFVYAISRQGCPSDTLTLDFDVLSTDVQAGPDQYTLPNQPVQLNAIGAQNYLWSPAFGLSNPNAPNPVANLRNTQTYLVTGFTSIGCATTDTITVFIVESELIQLPNAFSPNGDGLNDVFRLPLTVTKLNLFSVYNRFGQQVFSTKNRSNAWDGRFKGKAQDPGSYVWMLDAYNIRGERKQLKGSIILIR